MPAPRPLPAQIGLRVERPDDHDAVRAVHLEAFGRHGTAVADLVDDLRADVALGQGLSLLAIDHDAVVGHALFSAAWLDAPARLVAVQVLSPLAVQPMHERRGIGTALIERGLRILADRGVPLVLLEGAPERCARLGFVPASSLQVRRPSLRIPEAAFQAHVLPAHEPWMSGTLVYPEVWWRHDAVGVRDDAQPGPEAPQAPAAPSARVGARGPQ